MDNKNLMRQAPEIWGGIECTINRVGDDHFDQLAIAGYYDHPGWVDEIIKLGIKKLRFPVLWEKHQPNPGGEIDWNFTAHQLERLRKHDVIPIAGLLHHGSGPAFTNLLDPRFPELFAGYASQVARRFPWIKYYTPVNEPLTTARFSGLYGFWYPHKKNDVSFIKMLLNELKGIVLAMKEIRKINPEAQLVQTEDLGKVYSTTLLQYQANFENHRRWLTYDILCGRMNSDHALWNYFMRLGIDEQTLRFFIDNPSIPGIIGVNHYVTSERFLDENVANYPGLPVGGNSLHHYVDVEAVRVRVTEPHGISILLQEIWDRYKIPLAITEVHLHCAREEQLRWLKEVYDTASTLNTEGVNTIAVAPWALLGSFGWNKLLTCIASECEYETGAFDISGGYARPTALSALIKSLANRKQSNHLLGQAGWWKLDDRFLHKESGKGTFAAHQSLQPIVIIGKTGTLGRAFSRACKERNLPHYLLGRMDADICNSAELERLVNRYHPWAIINTAGFVKVDEAEENKDQCYRENYLGPQKLAILCEKYRIKLVTFSSDLVFDGKKTGPYNEDDCPNAINVYGHSKQLAETFCSNVNPSSLIIRTSAFFSPWDKYNFAYAILSHADPAKKIAIPDDITISPTYVPHLVHAALNLLVDDERGIWHLANSGSLTWFGFAKRIAEKAGRDIDFLEPGYNIETAALRPRNSALLSKKYKLMPSLDTAIDEFLQHYTPAVSINVHSKHRI